MASDSTTHAPVSLLAVDGHSLAHRAYHAIADTDDATEHFVTTGFMGMLGTVWGYGPFDAIVLAFDHPVNQRKTDFPEYKAQRDEDSELRTHIAELIEHMRAVGFEVMQQEGIEGDDILAAAADACEARGWQCTVVSSDRDLLALVSETTRLLRPRASMGDIGVYGPETVVQEYGVRPDQYTDLAAMRGDPSDGLEGATGIGPKIAARLLRDHDSLTGIYANLCNLDPRIEATLRSHRDRVERNRLLMSPLPHIEVDVERARAIGVDIDAIDSALAALGLGGAGGRFRWAFERPTPPPMAPTPGDEHAPPPDLPESILAGRESDLVLVDVEQDALF